MEKEPELFIDKLKELRARRFASKLKKEIRKRAERKSRTSKNA